MSELLTLRRFLELERRVHRIERKLEVDLPVGHAATVEPEPVIEEFSVLEEIPELAKPQVTAVAPPPLPIPTVTITPEPVQRVVPYATPEKSAPRKDTRSSLETSIGLNWTGWIGAIVLVVGAALGIKYGYDHAWFGGLPKELRLAFCFAGGLSLLGVGEWIDRKISRLSAAGVFAAGIATLFVVSYAGFGYFGLYAQTTAFVLMAISTLVGAAIAMRKNLVVIAILSLLGGNIAPLILQTAEPRIGALLGYILALQIVALFLASFGRGGKWWVLRVFAIAMPAFWTLSAYADSTGSLVLPLRFSFAYAVLVQAELIYASRKPQSLRNGLAAPASILVTALLTLSMLWGLHDHTKLTQGGAMLAYAGACLAAGFALCGHRPELSVSFRVQSALLVLIAVPVGLTGAPVMLAWAGLSLAYVIVGRRLQSEIGWWFGVAAWGLSVVYLAHWSQINPAAQEAFWLGFPRYLTFAVGLTIIGHALTHLLSKQDQNRVAVWTAIDLVASAVLVVAVIAAMTTWHATGAILLYAWALFIAGRLLARPAWEMQGGGALLLAVVKWGSVDMISTRLAPTTQVAAYLPVLNPVMGVGTLLAGSIVGMYAIQRRALEERLQASASALAISVATLVIAVMTFGLSIEVARVVDEAAAAGAIAWPPSQLRQLGWSMLWTAAAAIHAVLIVKLLPADERRRDWMKLSAVLMALVSLKFVLLDVLSYWAMTGPGRVTPLANLQMLAGLVVVGGLGLVWRLRDRQGLRWRFGGAMLMVILLLCGTVEIDRTFEHFRRAGTGFADARLAKQVAISIYWAVFAVASIIAGFRLRIAGLRYFGLALLAVALIKVVGFDLREIGSGYRILSFMGLGGLMLATSVVYGKLSPILLRMDSLSPAERGVS